MSGSQFRGRAVYDWGDEVKRLKREKNYDELVPLLEGMVAVIERESARDGLPPGPGYFKELALAYRRTGDFDAAIETLERYRIMDIKCGGSGARLEEDLRRTQAEKSKAEASELPFACPECGSLLPGEFVKSGPCPDCSVALTVKTVGGRMVATSKDSAAAAKVAKEKAKTREKYLRLASKLGYSEAEYDEVMAGREQAWGEAGRSDADVFWHIANKVAIDSAQSGDWHKCGLAYRMMADHLVERGEPWLEPQKQSVLAGLRMYASFKPPSLLLNVGGCKCDNCQPQGKQRLGEALEAPVIPHADCLTPPCSCHYWEPWPEGFASSASSATETPAPAAKKGFLWRLRGGQ